MISDPVAVLCVLAAVVFVSIRLEERFTLFKSLGAALVGILLAMLLLVMAVLWIRAHWRRQPSIEL